MSVFKPLTITQNYHKVQMYMYFTSHKTKAMEIEVSRKFYTR